MKFKDIHRLERVYYENIWTLLNTLRTFKDKPVDFDTVSELLDNAIADNESIIIIYKNLGELYNEISIRFTELGKELKDLRDNLEEWKDEINDKIDELNNVLMVYIREIWQRLDAIEEDLRTMNRVKFLDLIYDSANQTYTLELNGEEVDYDDVTELVDFPHLVVIRAETANGTRYYYQNDADPYSWDDIDLSGQTAVVEKTVSIDSVNGVTVSENKHQEFYIITATYEEPMPGGDYYRMRHDGNVITVTDIETAIASGKIPIFVYTVDNTGKTEIFNYNLHSNGFVQFENIHRRVDEDLHSYYVNTTFSAQGNFAAYAENELGKIYTAGTGIEITENNVINNTMEPCCGNIQVSLGEVIENETPEGEPAEGDYFLPIIFSGAKINKINYINTLFDIDELNDIINSWDLSNISIYSHEDKIYATLETLYALSDPKVLKLPWWYGTKYDDGDEMFSAALEYIFPDLASGFGDLDGIYITLSENDAPQNFIVYIHGSDQIG